MGLGAYKSPDTADLISSTSPLTFTFDGRYGGVQDRCIFLHNDDARLWYSDIVVSVADTGLLNIVDGSRPGFSWKLTESDLPPQMESWKYITAGASISISENLGQDGLSDIVSYLPVWVHVQIAPNLAAQNIKTVLITLTSKEHLV